jgi:hypothetical protein
VVSVRRLWAFPMSISPADESALDWYYGQALALFGQSVTGTMLDRADMFWVRRPITPAMFRAHQTRRPNEPPPDLLTVRSGSPHRATAVYVPDEAALRRYARVSNRLDRLSDPRARVVLEAYYGDAGARWGASDLGRILAVMPLTKAGSEVVERHTSDQPGLRLSPHEKLHSALVVQSVRPLAGRGRLLDAARAQAWTAYRWSCMLWMEARDRRTIHDQPDRQGSLAARGPLVHTADASLVAQHGGGSETRRSCDHDAEPARGEFPRGLA